MVTSITCHRGLASCAQGRRLSLRRPAVPMAVCLIAGIAAEPRAAEVAGRLVVSAGHHGRGGGILRSSGSLRLAVSSGVAHFFRRGDCATGGVLLSAHAHRAIRGRCAKAGGAGTAGVVGPSGFRAAAHGRPLPPKQFARAEVIRARAAAGWLDVSGEVALTLDQPHPGVAQGSRIAVVGLLQRPAVAMNPGEFDAAAYYRKQRVLATVVVPHRDGVTILGEPRFRCSTRCATERGDCSRQDSRKDNRSTIRCCSPFHSATATGRCRACRTTSPAAGRPTCWPSADCTSCSSRASRCSSADCSPCIRARRPGR